MVYPFSKFSLKHISVEQKYNTPCLVKMAQKSSLVKMAQVIMAQITMAKMEK